MERACAESSSWPKQTLVRKLMKKGAPPLFACTANVDPSVLRRVSAAGFLGTYGHIERKFIRHIYEETGLP